MDLFEAKSTGIPNTKSTHPIEMPDKKKRRTATPYDARSSTPGDMGPYANMKVSQFTGPLGNTPEGAAVAMQDIGIQQGGAACDGGAAMGGDCGGAACESTDFASFENSINGFADQFPDSLAIPEIRELFNACKTPDNTIGTIYHDAEDIAAEDRFGKIASLAAACEAMLNAFKAETGMDYSEFRNR